MVKRFSKTTDCACTPHVLYNLLLLIIIIYIIIFNIHKVININNTYKTDIQVITQEITIKQNDVCVKTDNNISSVESNYKINLCVEDENVLKRIAMAEAGNQGIYGKALVMQVVLNRVDSDKFPNTIKEVVFQKNQFSPTANGSYKRVTPDAECDVALDMVLNNEIETMNALYFTSQKEECTWHSKNLDYLFTHLGHKFYK